MIYGQNPQRESKPIQTDADGKILFAAADGGDATLGAKGDAAATDATSSWSVTALLKGILAMFRNPAVVTSTTITTAQAAPTLVSQLTAANSIGIASGTVDAVTARITNLGGGTPTIGFYGSDDGVNLYALSGLPISGTIGGGVLAQTGAAVGAWTLKGSGVRNVYMVCTALGGGANIGLSLAATPNQSRVTSVVRGSGGGSISAASGTATSEAVSVTGFGVTPTDRSGTITLGGTAQTAMASNSARKGFSLQNVSSGDLWINSLATAIVGQPSMKIPAGALYESPLGGCPTGAISIIGATTSQAFVGREW